MPEIGEVRAHAERLERDFAGRALAGFRPISFHVLKTFTPDPADAIGHELASISTRGKYLHLDFGSTGFVVHLMQGGRLRPDEKQRRGKRQRETDATREAPESGVRGPERVHDEREHCQEHRVKGSRQQDETTERVVGPRLPRGAEREDDAREARQPDGELPQQRELILPRHGRRAA